MSIEVDWTRLTGPEIRATAERGNALAILPVGSLEQHGPHLPVITDTRTAWEVSIRAARLVAADMPVLVLPGLWAGMSEHHLPFGGTISLNYQEFAGVIRGTVRSLRAAGFGRVLIVNGHGGNIEPLAVCARELAHEFGLPVVATTPWMIPDAAKAVAALMDSASSVQHACEAETSVMLAMTPQTVRTENFEAAMRQSPPPRAGRAGFSRFWAFSERAPATGVKGDPRSATAAKGEAMLDCLARAVADALADAELWTRPDDVWAPGRGLGSTVP
jgi:creatinine amidohydrolase